MSKEDITKIASSFRSYDVVYDELMEFGTTCLQHSLELEWMMDYFLEKEDYEKCGILKTYLNQKKDEKKMHK
jgi:hypothetical protein